MSVNSLESLRRQERISCFDLRFRSRAAARCPNSIGHQVFDKEGGMRFSGRAKILFNAEVHL